MRLCVGSGNFDAVKQCVGGFQRFIYKFFRVRVEVHRFKRNVASLRNESRIVYPAFFKRHTVSRAVAACLHRTAAEQRAKSVSAVFYAAVFGKSDVTERAALFFSEIRIRTLIAQFFKFAAYPFSCFSSAGFFQRCGRVGESAHKPGEKYMSVVRARHLGKSFSEFLYSLRIGFLFKFHQFRNVFRIGKSVKNGFHQLRFVFFQIKADAASRLHKKSYRIRGGQQVSFALCQSSAARYLIFGNKNFCHVETQVCGTCYFAAKPC